MDIWVSTWTHEYTKVNKKTNTDNLRPKTKQEGEIGRRTRGRRRKGERRESLSRTIKGAVGSDERTKK